MYQIDDTYAASSLPALPTDNVGTPGFFQGSNATIGQKATRLRFWWFNMIQEELRAIVLAAGIVCAKANNGQVLAAIQTLIANAVGNYLPLAGGNVHGPVAITGSNSLTVGGNALLGSLHSTGELYTSSYVLAGPTDGNFTPCQSAATGCSMAGGQVNAYNSAGSAGQFGTASSGDIVDFYVGNVGTISIQGKITTTGTGVVYGTTSDYRLKQDVVPLTGALDRVSQLTAKQFSFKSAPNVTVDGFLAHEAAEVVPQAVAGEKDAVDERGDVLPQTMDATALVPVLWAAVGELKALVDQQAKQIAALMAAKA